MVRFHTLQRGLEPGSTLSSKGDSLCSVFALCLLGHSVICWPGVSYTTTLLTMPSAQIKKQKLRKLRKVRLLACGNHIFTDIYMAGPALVVQK